jgi:ATP-dependent Clp protease ATP-binding subunit ClpX
MAYKEAFCSFCGRKKNEVDLLLSGTDGHICNHCIVQGNDLVQQELFGVDADVSDKKKKKKKAGMPKFDLRPPMELKKYLDKRFIITTNA